MKIEKPTIVNIVTARVYAMDNRIGFEVSVLKKEAKETKSSFIWEGRRVAKEKLLNTEFYLDGERIIGVRTYSLDKDVEEAKKLVVEQVKEKVAFRMNALNKMGQIMEQKPVLVIKEVEREEV